MPQASDEARALMGVYFGDEIDDGPPIRFLLARGYTECEGFWIKPTPSHSISDYEWDCLNFLCDEWDYAYDFKGLSNFTPPQKPTTGGY